MAIKVIVVDDSLFMRTLISDILNSDPEIEVVDKAKDGREAIKKISMIKPDCITLDLEMPGWDGLTTLENIMAENPTPVIILSAHSKRDADITMKCLDAGAVGFVLKPSGELSLDIKDVKRELLEEVKAASKISTEKIRSIVKKRPKQPKCKFIAANKIIVIGASTGGPQELETILFSLPVNFSVPIIVIQHMPSLFFTESFAEHLNKASELEVKIAENGEELEAGKVYIAPSGFETKVASDIKGFIKLSVTENKPDILSPSIDKTMESVAEIYKRNAVGIILSGMGHDGREGMATIKKYDGETIVQDESSLIFGMPKAVIDAGGADKVLPIEKIIKLMLDVGRTN